MTSASPSLGFWLKWLLTFLAFPLGGGVAFLLIRPAAGVGQAAVGGAITGLILGAAQWIVLRQMIAVSAWWIVATGLGLALGLALSIALLGTSIELRTLIIRAALTGGILGISQWLLFRQYVAMAGWWAVVVMLGWVIGWTVTRAAGVDLSRGWTVFGASGALVFAGLTGLALVWLLRHRLPL
jgi:hypothetical protein